MFLQLKKIAELAEIPYNTLNDARRKGVWQGCDLNIRELKGIRCKGGVGYEIEVASLPKKIQEKIMQALPPSEDLNTHETALNADLNPILTPVNPPAELTYSPESLWGAWEVASPLKKAEAERKLKIIKQIESLIQNGYTKNQAIEKLQEARSKVFEWYKRIEQIEEADWLPALLSEYQGRAPATESYHPEIYEAFKAYYLSPARRSANHAYELAKLDAASNGWGEMPSIYLLKSRIQKEVHPQVFAYLREGRNSKTFQNPVPPQIRDKSMLNAMEWINGDGYDHEFYVIFPDGIERKPVTWFWQDVYSGAMLGHYTDISENSDMLRLALRDTIQKYGMGINGKPFKITVDNTRAASAKALTGRATNRHRYTLRPDEPLGVFGRLGCEYRPTQPYRGQAKPIERKFGIGGISELVDRHPAVEKARTAGNGITWQIFQQILSEAIKTLNTRVSRSKVCGGIRTPEQVFNTSMARNISLRATSAQLNMLMMCAVGVPADRKTGAVKFLNNIYWNEALTKHCGEKVMVEYDPQNLHDGVNVYTLQGQLITQAPCNHAVGWADTNAAREQAKLIRSRRKDIKNAADKAVQISALERTKREISATPDGQIFDKNTGEIIPAAPAKPMRVVQLDFTKSDKPQGMSEAQKKRYAERMAEQRQRLKQAV